MPWAQLRETHCFDALKGVEEAVLPIAQMCQVLTPLRRRMSSKGREKSEGAPHLCNCLHLLSSVALRSHSLNCQRPMWLVCTITCSKEARQGPVQSTCCRVRAVNMLQG